MINKPYNMAIIGRTGSGKSTLVRKLINHSNLNPYIFDPNNEHNGINTSIAEFLENAKNRENSLIVFEEATIFFSHSNRTENIINLMVRKRHTGNSIIFVFHSLRALPLYIIDLLDLIVLFKTNENKDLILRKFKEETELISAFLAINKDKNEHSNILINRRK